MASIGRMRHRVGRTLTLRLQDGTPDLQDGTPDLQDGTPDLQDGTPSLQDGTPRLQDGTPCLEDGLLHHKLRFQQYEEISLRAQNRRQRQPAPNQWHLKLRSVPQSTTNAIIMIWAPLVSARSGIMF